MTMSLLRSILLASLLAAAPAALAQQTVGERMDDAEISARVKAALIDDETTKARNIDVETQSGVVQLSGFVESEESKSAAEAAARSVEGVAQVQNALIVRQGERSAGAVVDDSVIAAKVKTQLADEAGLGTASAVNVEVNKGVVQLSGFVDSEDKKSRAETVAHTIEGVAEVRNDIAVQH
jgi:hyperosmotically inducible periplasmic protein